MVDYKAEIKELKKAITSTSDKDEKVEIRDRVSLEIRSLRRAAKDSRVGAKEAIQRPLETIEAIDEGQVLPHRMSIR